MRIVVLGGGRVGSAIVRDLAAEEDFSVLVVDVDPVAAERLTRFGADCIAADLSDPNTVSKAVVGADLVVGAVPGFMGYKVVEQVLREGRPVVDISFFPENAFGLDELAKEAGVPCLVDCGVAPGLSNLISGHMDDHLDVTHSFNCLVGGLPVERSLPWEYKAPFSPGDVIEEYTRPARLRRGGKNISLPALSEIELVDFPGLGTLEAFNTDGLRSLLTSSQAPEMVEKTLRYPGHAEKMRMLRETGFVMRIVVEGDKEGKTVRHTYELLDYYNTETETSSMARTTGYTCTGMVRLITNGIWDQPGVAPPEIVGRNIECFDAVIEHLKDRKVQVFHSVKEI